MQKGYFRTIKTVMIFFGLSLYSTLIHANTAAINSLPANPEQYIDLLKAANMEEAARVFIKAHEQEDKKVYGESMQHFLELNKLVPESPYVMWRLARIHWIYAENLDINDKEGRMKYFGDGLAWAEKGIALNPNCAECYLYRFGNLGRISTTKGLMSSISSAKDLSRTIAKAIELKPQHGDAYYNREEANAYYASGVFYRIIPDWLIIKWIAGVRGDKMKALEHIQKAAELIPARVDYQVELGAIYLCLAEDKGMEEMRELGNATLRHAIDMKQVLPTDALDKEYAKGFLKDPRGACGFSRDGIVELDKDKVEAQNL